MERLTERDHKMSDYAYLKCSEECAVPRCDGCSNFERLVDRLAAYEDTGLEPEDLRDYLPMLREWRQDTGALRYVIEMVKADAENRLLVLPCKAGGDLWVNDKDGKPRRMVLDTPDIRCHCAKKDNLCMALCDSPNAGICAYRLKNDGTDFGKTVFLTREEAEEKLKEDNDEKTQSV